MNTLNPFPNAANLKNQLKNFCGTETWFRHGFNFLHTEGVQFLAEEAGASWLIELIFGFQIDQQAVRDEPFQTWDLVVDENKTATLTCGDGNGNTIFTHNLAYTDFPLDEIRLFFTDNVLLLTTEY